MVTRLLVTFLACPKKGNAQEAHPAKIPNAMLGRPRYISETRPSGSDSPKCFTLGLGRLAKFSHGNHASSSDSNHCPKPRTSLERTYSRGVQAKFWGTRLGLRKRPAGEVVKTNNSPLRC